MTIVGFHKKEMKLLLCNSIVVEKISLFSKVMLNHTVRITRDCFPFLVIFSIYLDTFAFDSRRHQDYSFALSFYINGLISCRVSVCCEFKHKKNAPLGGPSGSFAIQDVLHAKRCETFVEILLLLFLDEKIFDFVQDVNLNGLKSNQKLNLKSHSNQKILLQLKIHVIKSQL